MREKEVFFRYKLNFFSYNHDSMIKLLNCYIIILIMKLYMLIMVHGSWFYLLSYFVKLIRPKFNCSFML